jgi:hypothetical protein
MATFLLLALVLLALGLAILAHLQAVPQEIGSELPESVDYESPSAAGRT